MAGVTHRTRGRVDARLAAEYAAATGAVLLTSLLGVALRSHLSTIDMAMLLLLAVAVVASRLRPGPALAACVLSIAAFDFAFVPPFYTLHVADTAYILTFAVMLLVATLISRLTARIRAEALEAEERADAAAALSALTQDLAPVSAREELAAIAARHIARATGGAATIHLVESPGATAAAAELPLDGSLADPEVHLVATWAWRAGRIAGAGTGRFEDARVLIVPLRSESYAAGVAAVTWDEDPPGLTAGEAEVLAALGNQVALALERAALMARHEGARVEVEAERLRTALLSSLSHDLRTPLASIEGAASSLLHAADLPAGDRRELAETILGESRRMTSLVVNLLDMVRVESGALAVHRQWQPLEESLGVALLRLEETLRFHPVTVTLPADLPLVPVDEILIEQVFINLLENAARHTPPGTPIAISAVRRDTAVEVTVADRGPGIAAGSEVAVFEKFQRGAASDRSATAGAGLGLTICRGILTAHGGRIWVDPVPGGGSAFRFLLPLSGLPEAGIPAEAAEPVEATS